MPPFDESSRLHPATFLIVLNCTGMQWRRQCIFDHLLFFKMCKCRVELFKGFEIVKDRLDDLINHFSRHPG